MCLIVLVLLLAGPAAAMPVIPPFLPDQPVTVPGTPVVTECAPDGCDRDA